MDEETRKLLEQANAFNSGIQTAPVKPKRNFLTSLLPTAGSILGGIAGSFAAPGVGTAAGGAAGGILGLKLRNALTGQEDTAREYLTEGAFGALGGIGKAAKSIRGASTALKAGDSALDAARILRSGVPTAGSIAKEGLISKLGSKLEKGGDALLGTQSNLTRAETRQLGRGMNPATILGDINKRTGLTSMESMSNVGSKITGSDGVFNELRKNAIGNSRGVDIGDLRNVADDLLLDKAPLITGSKRTSVLDSVKNNVVKSYGGSKGSLNKLADPFEAFDAAGKFDAMAADLTRGATVSAADRQLASVYKGLSKSINNRLFATEGVSEGLKLAKPQAQETLLQLAKTAPKKEAAAYTKLAKELDTVADIPSLRKAQSSFVNLGKIDEATANARSGAAAALGGQMQGAGKLVQRPLNAIALPLDAATPGIAGMMTRGGRALQSIGGGGSGSLAGFLKMQAGRGALTGMAAGQDQGAAAGAVDPMTGLPTENMGADILGGENMTPYLPDGTSGPLDPTTKEPISQSMYSREAAAKDIQADLERTGGKNMDKYMALYEFMNPEPAADPKLSATQQQRATAAENALMDMGQIESAISSGKLGGLKSLPGAGTALGRRLLGTEDLDAALFNVADNILRARSGAATPEAEVKRFASSFLPNPTDSEEAKFAKLRRAQRELQGYVNPVGSGGAEDIFAQLGY